MKEANGVETKLRRIEEVKHCRASEQQCRDDKPNRGSLLCLSVSRRNAAADFFGCGGFGGHQKLMERRFDFGLRENHKGPDSNRQASEAAQRARQHRDDAGCHCEAVVFKLFHFDGAEKNDCAEYQDKAALNCAKGS
jgi:hypothetical protein